MNTLNALARLLWMFVALWCGMAQAQSLAPTVGSGSKVSGSMHLGRVAFALPPGEWLVVPLADMAITKADYSCRCELTGGFRTWPVQQAFAVQLDPLGGQLKAAIYFRASQATVPLVRVWFTSACEARPTALYRDGVDGNFNYPACLSIEALDSPSTGPLLELETWLWNWMKANGIEIPHALLAAKYFKYGTGDLVWVIQYVNPDHHGIKAPAQRNASEWTADAVKADPQKSEYLARLKSWSHQMAEESRRSLREGKPKETSLPAIPVM